jgi:hypothetical protein
MEARRGAEKAADTPCVQLGVRCVDNNNGRKKDEELLSCSSEEMITNMRSHMHNIL